VRHNGFVVDHDAVARLDNAVQRLARQTRDRAPTGLSHDDADEVVGTVATDDARGFDPMPLLRAFHGAGVPVVVIGQVAGILHGSTELTGDLDLLWDGDMRHAAALTEAFGAVSAALFDGDGAPLPCEPSAFAKPKVLFRTAHASGDCCTPALPWGDLPIVEFLTRHRIAVAADGVEIRYLDRADLIRMRRAAGRPKDLRRADELER
jgi:hypothetical protein